MTSGSVGFFQPLTARSESKELTWSEKVVDYAERYWWVAENRISYDPDAPVIEGLRPAIFWVSPHSNWRPLKIASYCFAAFHYACNRLCPTATQFWAVRSVLWVGTLFPVAALLVKVWHRQRVGESYVYKSETANSQCALSSEEKAALDQLLGLEYGLIDRLQPREIVQSEAESSTYRGEAPIERLHVMQDGADTATKVCIKIQMTPTRVKGIGNVVIYPHWADWKQRMMTDLYPNFFHNNACIINRRLNPAEKNSIARLQTVLREGKGQDRLGKEWVFDKSAWERIKKK